MSPAQPKSPEPTANSLLTCGVAPRLGGAPALCLALWLLVAWAIEKTG